MAMLANDKAGKLILRVALGVIVLLHGIAKLKGGIDPITGMVTGAGLPGAGAQHLLQLHARRHQRGRDGEQQHDEHVDRDGDAERSAVHVDLAQPGQPRRGEGDESADRGRGESGADDRRGRGEERTLGEQLAHDAGPPGA